MVTGLAPSGKTGIYYEVAGAGPAVVFIHAGIADARMWASQLAGLADRYRVVAFDQRGFGRTAWEAEGYADRRDVIAVMDHVGIGSAVLVGCSLGGGIAMHVALAAPDRVDALVLIGAAARGWEPAQGWSESPLWDQAEKAYEAGDFETALRLDAEIWVVGHGRSLQDVDRDVFDLVIEMNRIPMATEKERNDHVEAFEPPVNDRLDEIEVPTLVMVGAHDEPDLTESAAYLAGRLSNRSHVIIDNAAHLPSLEQPEAFNKSLVDFLSSF